MILIDTKTGRHWPIRDYARGHRLARNLGLVDYEMEPAP